VPSIPLRVARLAHLKEERDGYYRAIGRYMVEFSSLVAFMRDLVAHKIVGTDEKATQLIRLAFGSLQAQQVADGFFAVCRASADPPFDRSEQAIEKCLRENHVNAEIRWRNVIAHGDWFVPEWVRVSMPEGAEDDPAAPPVAYLSRVQHHKPTPLEPKPLTIEEIDTYGERVQTLRALLWEFGMVCTRTWDHDPARGLEPVRVSDAFELVGSANDRTVQFRADYGDKLKQRGLAR
jgi:hypothetical protein